MLAVTLAGTATVHAQPPLQVLGGDGARTLVLHLCGVSSNQSATDAEALTSETCRAHLAPGAEESSIRTPEPVLVGALRLEVTNTSSQPRRIHIRYFREDGASALLPGKYSYVYMAGAARQDRRWVVLRPHTTVPLSLYFALSRTLPSTALDGTLNVVLSEARQVISIPMSVTVPAPPGVALEPKELTLSNNRSSGTPTATLSLVGPGAAAFARAVGVRHSLVLYDSTGDTATFKLGSFTESANGVVSGDLTAVNNPAPGAYKGELHLFPLSPAAPALTLSVNSHRSIWWAIALVFIGVLVGVVALRFLSLDKRRNTLSKALDDALQRYNDAYCALPQDVRRTMWSLHDLAEADGGPRPQASGLLPGVAALYERIAEANNDHDLDEDTDSVLDVVAQVQRWLRLAPLAWQLDELARRSPRPDRWHGKDAWRELQLLKASLSREPASSHAADDTVARILWLIPWYKGLVELYDATEGDPDLRKATVFALDHKLSEEATFTRTALQRDELSVELEKMFEKAKRRPLIRDYVHLELTDELSVSWRTTPSLFTGWATIGGTGLRLLRVQSEGRRHTRAVKLSRPMRTTAADRASRFAVNLVASLPSLGASSIVYAVFVYNSTWGSATDVVTALIAGFAGKVTIDDRTLAIFQSVRLRASSAASPTQASAKS